MKQTGDHITSSLPRIKQTGIDQVSGSKLVITLWPNCLPRHTDYRWLVMERLVSGKQESGQERDSKPGVRFVDAQMKTEDMRDFTLDCCQW